MSRLTQAIVAVLFVLVSLGSRQALAATAAPAASDAGNGSTGIGTLIQPPTIQGGNRPMLFERFGPLAYTPLTVSTSTLLTEVPGSQPVTLWENEWASAEGTGLVLMGEACVAAVEWAFNLDVVTQVGSPIDTVIGNLHAQLYGKYIGAVLFLLACWLGWVWLARKRLLHGITGLVWGVLALVVGAILMAAPAEYLGNANAFSNELATASLAGIANEDPALTTPDTTDNAGPSEQDELRVFANRMWTTWVYDPWTFMEFGQVDPKVQGRQLGVELLQKNSHQQSTYDSDINPAPQTVQDWASGKDGVWRLVYGGIMLFVAGAGALMTLLIALLMLGAGLAVLVLACVMVPVLLVAPIPGFGRRMFERWLGLLLVSLGVKVVAALYLVAVLAVTGAVAALQTQTGWFVTALLSALTMWVAWHMRKSFFHAGHRTLNPGLSAAQPKLKVGATGAGSQSVNMAGNVARNRLVRARLPQFQAASPVQPSAARLGGRVAAKGAQGDTAKGAAVTGGSIATAGVAAGALVALKAGQSAIRTHDKARRWTQAQAGHLLGEGALPQGDTSERLPHQGHPAEAQALSEPLVLAGQKFRDHRLVKRGGRMPPPPPSSRRSSAPSQGGRA